MGTSAQQHPTTITAVSAAPGTTTNNNNTTICRRDSGGSGTNFLTNNNVTVRGRCSPVTSCGHHDSKREGQGKDKADHHTAAAAAARAEFRLASSSATTMTFGEEDIGNNAGAYSLEQVDISSASAATNTQGADADGMDAENEEDDDISVATTHTQSCDDCSEDESHYDGGNKHHEGLSSHDDMMDSFDNHSQRNHHVLSSSPLTHPFQAQQQTSLWNNSFSHPPAIPASVATCASPNTRALQSMQRILNLNQSAINLYLTGRDDHWALDALHKAEWIRCHLVDELAIVNNSQASGQMMMACQSVVNKQHAPSGLSLSFTSAASVDRPRQMRRVGSFDDNNIHRQLHDTPSLGNVARTSYIYQRMDFDEGMHSFVNLESIDPATVWQPIGSRDYPEQPSLYELSPVVEATFVFNYGQIHRRKGDLDAASKCYDRALAILRYNSVPIMQMHCHHPMVISILHNIGQLQ
mmetsp:Transcript_4565/g.10309  ORF Transcript_4565/g.10309 Transcript_4565/m.10309 type:complete len:467 (+) Transcript_4565:246-1646(+)